MTVRLENKRFWKSPQTTICAILWGCFASLTSASPGAATNFPVSGYGAACNSNATTGEGTDDTNGFIAAAMAAHSAYLANGVPQTVALPAGKSCRIDGTVTIGSGVIFEGPGTIVVPVQKVTTLLFQNADNSGVEKLMIKVLSGPGGNNAFLSSISWAPTSTDAAQHSHFFARGNTLIDGSWGIFVRYNTGTGSLTSVDISNNSVTSSSASAYTNADGIHVAGRVSGITIGGNHVSNRGDAAIALTSEPGPYVLSGAVVSDNVCLNDSVGLDNSGATNAVWSNNTVRATISLSKGSNPAARSITYLGATPVNVKFIGNEFENFQGPGTEPTVKVDNHGSNLVTNVEWTGNTIAGTSAMWLAGNTITVNRNTFSPDATIWIEYDADHLYPGENIHIGLNYWKGSGTISAPGNPSLYKNLHLARQQAAGTIKVVGQSNFRH
jgi:hypothetical protein